jgi:putative oxidoreductase
MNTSSFSRWGDTTLAALRVLTGAVLIHQTWAAMPSGARVGGMVGGLAHLHPPAAAIMPPLMMALEFIAGVLLVLGLLTRWGGLLLAAIIAVAVIRTGLPDPLGAGWPRLMLFVLGLHFAAAGPGRFAVDGLFARRTGGGKRR